MGSANSPSPPFVSHGVLVVSPLRVSCYRDTSSEERSASNWALENIQPAAVGRRARTPGLRLKKSHRHYNGNGLPDIFIINQGKLPN